MYCCFSFSKHIFMFLCLPVILLLFATNWGMFLVDACRAWKTVEWSSHSNRHCKPSHTRLRYSADINKIKGIGYSSNDMWLTDMYVDPQCLKDITIHPTKTKHLYWEKKQNMQRNFKSGAQLGTASCFTGSPITIIHLNGFYNCWWSNAEKIRVLMNGRQSLKTN